MLSYDIIHLFSFHILHRFAPFVRFYQAHTKREIWSSCIFIFLYELVFNNSIVLFIFHNETHHILWALKVLNYAGSLKPRS